jgi:hypothetical protein
MPTSATEFVCHKIAQTGQQYDMLQFCKHAQLIAFSSQCEHALHLGNLFTGLEDLNWSPSDVKFDRKSGWILGPHKELILWIPLQHRRGLHLPRSITNCGVKPTELDLSQFVHGNCWMKCHAPSS